MLLVEQHIIRKIDPRWQAIDSACFLSKNLWNYANYLHRQAFINVGRWISYKELAHELLNQVDFCALPRKVAQWVLRQLDAAWNSWNAARKEYAQNPAKFPNQPALPNYKHKTKGRNMLVYTLQAINKRALRQGIIKPSGLDIEIKTRQTEKTIRQVRVVPRKSHYVIEVIFLFVSEERKKDKLEKQLNSDWIASIDIGLDNLAAVTSNKPGFRPLLVNGKPLKHVNQFYNKRLAQLKSELAKQFGEEHRTSNRILRLHDKRNRRIKNYLHTASHRIIEKLLEERIGTLVIGKNDNWKQNINIGKRNNQQFAQIPHARFINMLTYKAQLAGIEVKVVEESYTSKCSFLDWEPIQKHEQYAGKRISRGLFRAGSGMILNADVNGSLNILRKAFPKAFDADGIEVANVVQPMRVNTA